MNINIQGSNFPLTAPLLLHAERRLSFSLARSKERIKRVIIRVGDTNGPRGGEDKYCRIFVHLTDAQPVVIKAVGADLYSVITQVTERAGRNVMRRVDRLKRQIHRSRRDRNFEPVIDSTDSE